MKRAIVCASGGYRVSFVQGVLRAFEAAGLRADAYAGTSASVLPAAFAAVGDTAAGDFGVSLRLKETSPNGMSGVMLGMIALWSETLHARLFEPHAPRFCIPACAVVTPDAAAQTQGDGARRLGRRLLLAAANRDSTWAREHLRLDVFDTHGEPHGGTRLTPGNFDEVAYASTRMMHAWDIPATIGGAPYVDASYLCQCPALELAEKGYDEVIAIATTPGDLYRDLFGTQVVPGTWAGARIQVIAPDVDPKTLGADFTDATHEGMHAVFEHGMAKGRAFLGL